MVVADNQYAPLGLMLMATLAKVKKVVEPFREEVHATEAVSVKGEGKIQGVDFGERVAREELEDRLGVGTIDKKSTGTDIEEADADLIQPGRKRSKLAEKSQKYVEGSPPTKRSKKRRKKGDTFDALFDGLI